MEGLPSLLLVDTGGEKGSVTAVGINALPGALWSSYDANRGQSQAIPETFDAHHI